MLHMHIFFPKLWYYFFLPLRRAYLLFNIITRLTRITCLRGSIMRLYHPGQTETEYLVEYKGRHLLKKKKTFAGNLNSII